MRSNWQRASIVALCAAWMGGSADTAIRVGEDNRSSLPRSLVAGESVEEALDLGAGRYFEIEIEQVEGDLTVELVDPQGRIVASSDLPGKPWLDEVVAAVTDAAGVHTLRVQAKEDGSAKFDEVGRRSRRARPRDRSLIAGLALRASGLEKRSFETAEDLEAAEELFGEALVLLDEAGASAWSGRVLRELARCHRDRGDSDLAKRRYREAIERLERAGDDRQLATALNGYGDLFLGTPERQLAREAFTRALDLARRADDPRQEAESWNNLGVYEYHEGRMEQVVEAFERSLEIGAQAGRVVGRANTLSNLGAVYRALGRYSDALEISREALELARRLEDRSQEMRLLNNRGVLLKNVGDLRAAIDDYKAALRLADRLGAPRWQAIIGANLGAIYRTLGHRRRALEHLGKALDAAIAADSRNDEVWALLTIGELLREDGDSEAETFFHRARDRSREAGNRAAEAFSLYGLGRSRQDAGEPAAATELLTAALELLEQTSDRPGQQSVHRELARALAALGSRDEAQRHFASAISLSRIVGDPYNEAAARARYAQFLLDGDDLESARREVTLALGTIESLRQGVVEPDLRAGLLSRSQHGFTLLVDILEKLDRRFPREGYAAQAFEVAERSRARSLVELLTESEADLIRDLPRELQSRRSDLAGRLSATQRSLTDVLSAQNLDGARASELRAEVQSLNREREALEREMRLSDPRWDRLVYPEPLDLAASQRLLEPDQALVSFVLGERGSFVFAITESEIAFERIPSEDELRPRIEAFRSHIETPGRRSLGRFREVAAQLYTALLSPVERVLADRQHLLVSPDGVLHYVPFEALVRPARAPDDPEEYLLARWAVSYLPSASTLQVLRSREPRGGYTGYALAAFADPSLPGPGRGVVGEGPTLRGLGERESWRWRRLAGARSEVEAIAGLFDPSQVKVFLGEAASERRFRGEDAVRRARYVHLASHAVIDNDEPALSSLLLTAGGVEEDGLLQAHEVFELELDAELVVLSGCETALGRAVRGEGLLGMTRAFLYAGADAVAVSLWPVEDDSTSSLMVGFYSRLTGGADAALALRQAKLAQIAGGVHAHPYYWAPFVLVGSPS